jgi:hypothetical protein
MLICGLKQVSAQLNGWVAYQTPLVSCPIGLAEQTAKEVQQQQRQQLHICKLHTTL